MGIAVLLQPKFWFEYNTSPSVLLSLLDQFCRSLGSFCQKLLESIVINTSREKSGIYSCNNDTEAVKDLIDEEK